MSKQYDLYLEQHKSNVKKAFNWLRENIPELTTGDFDIEWQAEWSHDYSKNDPDEYRAYDAYFYGKNRSYSVVQEFNKAWLLHIHRNPHHWQYWVLINDNPEEGTIAIPMPDNYIIEMICDWWSFSWAKENLDELFSWYDKHEKHMILHPDTRKTVESILELIRIKLKEATDDA